MADERRYSEQEVRAILERAMHHDKPDGLSHSDLLEAAKEAGISPSAVEQAALDVEQGRELDAARQRILSRRRSAFMSHFLVYIVVNVFLVALNAITTPGRWWAVFPLLGWGMAVALSARFGLSKDVSERALMREVARASASQRRLAGAARQPAQRGRLELGDLDAEEESDEGAGRERRRRRR
jgi:hypothetical protein